MTESFDPLTRGEAITWLKRSLGGGIVVLELCQEHFEDSFADAIRWFVGRFGIKRRALQNIVGGIQEYKMPDDCDEVLEVWFPGVQIDIIAAVNPFAFIDIDQLPVAYQSITGVPGGAFYGTLEQILMHAETARRVVGSEPAWEYFQDTNVLHIAPRSQRGGIAIARYASTTFVADDPIKPEKVPVNDFRRIKFRHRELILRYALAKVKERLGRVRGKYTEWPGAGGGKTLDGEALLSESREDVVALNEEIMGLNEGVPFLVG
jgi:hypothetical protein